MAKAVVLSARLTAELDAQLARLAAATGRSKSWHVTAALEAYPTAALKSVALAGFRGGRSGRVERNVGGCSRLGELSLTARWCL
jgi:predicted transcriptional regulator